MPRRFSRLLAVLGVLLVCISCAQQCPPAGYRLTPIERTPSASGMTTTSSEATTTTISPIACATGEEARDGICQPCKLLKPCFDRADEMRFVVGAIYPTIDKYYRAYYADKPPPIMWVPVYAGQWFHGTCGPVASNASPFYCSYGGEIFLGEDTLWEIYQKYPRGDAVIAVIMAHESGHGVQRRAGQVYSAQPVSKQIRMENQADCVSGVIAKFMADEGFFSNEDLAGVEQFIPSLSSDEATHGSDEERLNAFRVGYRGDMTACDELGIGPISP